jgi:hypothetical protein
MRACVFVGLLYIAAEINKADLSEGALGFIAIATIALFTMDVIEWIARIWRK